MIKINKLTKIISIIISLAFIFFLYKDFNASNDLKGYYLVNSFFFLFLIFLIFLIIKFVPKFQTYFNIIFLSIFFSLYAFEFYLFKTGEIKFFTKKEGFWFNDYINLQNEIIKKNGYISESFNDNKVLSFGGLSNSKIIHCNENGYFSSYLSDRYGFNNPDYVWDVDPKIVIMGDSYIHGSCVNPGYDIASNLRKNTGLNTINLGWHGTGPLRQYSSFLELIENFPKYVIWFYFENDLEDLNNELKNRILLSYLENKEFKQNLKDPNKRSYINKKILIRHKEFMNTKFKSKQQSFYDNFKDFLKLYNSRQIIIYNLNKYMRIYNYDMILEEKKILKVYLDLIENLNNLSKENNSELIIAYLPRQKYGFSRRAQKLDVIKNQLINFTNIKQIRFIDIEEIIDNSFVNPTILYPRLHRGMHFNEKGYKFAADKITNYLNK